MPDQLFDRVVVADWSASSTPKRGADSIWIATEERGRTTIENIPTRAGATERLLELCRTDHRTLLGVDFSLGYPVGTAAALRLAGRAWEAMWRLLAAEVTDDEANRNNRFEAAASFNRRIGGDPGPFWGRPAKRSLEGLDVTKPVSRVVPQWRTVEAALIADGLRPFSVWQLLGVGSVGSQSLVGIPVLERLRRTLGGAVQVWPFTTGLTRPATTAGDVVIVEVWPTMHGIDVPADRIKDAVQVEALARLFADVDRVGRLGEWFEPDLPSELAGPVEAEEGWVLGVAGSTGRGCEG